MRSHNNGTRGRSIGLHEEFVCLRDIIRSLKPSRLRGVVALEIQDQGFMMSKSKFEPEIGSPHRKQGMSHHVDFEMH